MPESEVNRWVDKLQLGNQLYHDMDLWDKKTLLQKAFGSAFDDFNDKEWKYWKVGHKDLSVHDTEIDIRIKLMRAGSLTIRDKLGIWTYYPKGPWATSVEEYTR